MTPLLSWSVPVLTWRVMSTPPLVLVCAACRPGRCAPGRGTLTACAARRRSPGTAAVAVGNPQTAEFEVCRTTLLPSALKTISANKHEPLPIRLFEISDVVLPDASREVGARNERRLVAVHCAKASEFEVIHGLLNRVMQVLHVPHEGENAPSSLQAVLQAKGSLPAYWSPLLCLLVLSQQHLTTSAIPVDTPTHPPILFASSQQRLLLSTAPVPCLLLTSHDLASSGLPCKAADVAAVAGCAVVRPTSRECA